MRDFVYSSHTVRDDNETNGNVTDDQHSTTDTWRKYSLLAVTSIGPPSLPSNVSDYFHGIKVEKLEADHRLNLIVGFRMYEPLPRTHSSRTGMVLTAQANLYTIFV